MNIHQHSRCGNTVPTQARHAHGSNNYYCFLKTQDGHEARKVSIGPTNDKYVVITDGLAVDEEVTLNPRRFLGEVELPVLTAGEAQQVVKSVPISPGLAAGASSVSPDGAGKSAGGRR